MSQEHLPKSVLYATSARIGGVGLDLVAHETLKGIEPLLGKAYRTAPTLRISIGAK